MPRLRRLEFALGVAAWAVPRPLPGPPGGQAPARAPGGAGFKGQRPLRTGSPPFKLGLALTASAQVRICVGCGSLVGAAARLACAACPAAASAAHDAFAAIAAAALIQARWLVLMCLRMPLIFSEYVDPLCLYTPWLILALLFAGPTNSIF